MNELTEGGSFAGFHIERRLGAGGMGEVYLARHPRLPKLTALKVLLPGLVDDAQFSARFLREAELAAQLDHPNIVTVFDRGREGDRLWIAMQYVHGVTAGAALSARAMPSERAVRIVAKAAKALDYAHAAQILHRDIKPENILLAYPRADQGERIMLADFGIAKSLDSTNGLTAQGEIVASFHYASPEQIEGSSRLDRRSDVYSMGVTLFQLLTGERPYTGGLIEVITGHLEGAIPQPTRTDHGRRLGLPRGIDDVIQQALAKDPTDRFPSCGALARAAKQAFAPRPLSTGSIGSRLPPRNPTPTWSFALVVVRLGRRILLVRERKFDQEWYFPAGRVNPGETFEQAARRKTYEESGVDVTLEGLLGINHDPQPDGTVRMRVIFVARPTDDHRPRSAPNEKTLGADWMTIDDMKRLPLRGAEVDTIARFALKGGRVYPLSVVHSHITGAT